MRLLLSLLGEQPIPALLPLWQTAEYRAVRFAATAATLPLAQTIAAAIRRDRQLKRRVALEPLQLDPYDIGQARAVLAKALEEHRAAGDAVTINLTGGTKLMVIAALQAAYGSGVPLLYVTTEKNQIIYLGSDGAEQRRETIQVKISVEQYLAVHGLEASDNQAFNPHRGRDVHPDKEGDPLEEMVENLARQSGKFDDVRRGLFIRRMTDKTPVPNELDIVVTRNGRLAVCSCKTGKSVDKESIYEVSSISRREAAGIYCGKALITDLDPVPPALLARAKAMQVILLGKGDLPLAAERLLDATR
jgi:hypothetical protein